MFWWKPWEPLLETKPQSGPAAVVDLLAKELVEVLEEFPPQSAAVDWQDERVAARFAGRMEELPRLDSRFVAMLLRLVKLDLQNEIEQVDWIWRNEQYREACPTQAHVNALQLLWPAVLEHLTARKEECKGILKRPDLVMICERAEERFRQRALRARSDPN